MNESYNTECSVTSFFHWHIVFKFHPCCSILSVLHSFLQLKKYSTVWMHHILFIHSSFDGHLASFHFGAAINIAAMNISAYVFVQTYVFISHGYS